MNGKMAALRIFLHGFFLISLNLFSLITAVVAVQVASIPGEKLVQSSIALFINLGIYILVFQLMKGIQKEIMEIDDYSMFIIILLISLALLPVVFYPMHYLTSGHWSSFDKIPGTWLFQFILNGLCLTVNRYVLVKKQV